MTDKRIRQFVECHRGLLASELKSEEEEEVSFDSKQKKNDCDTAARVLGSLDVEQVAVGLFGRTVVTLATHRDSDRLLPMHRFTTGDEVQILSKSRDHDTFGGVVCALTETSISIALFDRNREQDEIGTPPLTVVSKSSIDVHNKLIHALDELERFGTMHPVAGKVVQTAFGTDRTSLSTQASKICAFNAMLDESQVEAISFSLTEGRYVSLIHGPPGTGKTSTIAELIQQAVHNFGYKVLVTAPSNAAVDNILERIVEAQPCTSQMGLTKQAQRRIRMVRLGHPARIKDSILPYSLEALVQSADGTEIVEDVRKELNSFLQLISNPKSRGVDKRTAYHEIKALRQEVRAREQKVVDQLINGAQVVLATTVGAGSRILKQVDFDLVVIDEAAQALEASCWIPILKGKQLVLAGDHCQLPPTIKSNDPTVRNGLAMTLFERLMEEFRDYADQISRMLNTQYRMHEDIANWASAAMYNGELKTHESARYRKLSDLNECRADQPAFLLIDTAGCGMDENLNAARSRSNEGEAHLVVHHVKGLIQQGMRAEQIAVISPYNGQVEMLKALLLPHIPNLEIRSVDGFQGGEREAVVLSLVRSNTNGIIGFLKDERRLNVAVTRARRHCAIICDTQTVSHHGFISDLLDYIGDNGVYVSAVDYQQFEVMPDFQDAETELLTLSDQNKDTDSNHVSTDAKPKNQKLAFNQKRKNETENFLTILKQCSEFATRGKPGEELVLSTQLASCDRRVIHELATKLGVGHKSEGAAEVDRHLILKIPSSNQNIPAQSNNASAESESDDHGSVLDYVEYPKVSAFVALGESSSEDEAERNVAPTTLAAPNQLLGSLAIERQQRKQNSIASGIAQPQNPAAAKSKKSKTKRGQKLGGSTRSPPIIDNIPPDLDDMAYLESQIEEIQNSHGRRVQGKGGFKTIVNGVLLTKSKEASVKANPRASAALNFKLKKAQESRKANIGKKK